MDKKFSLTEWVVLAGVLAIILAVVLVATNQERRVAQQNNRKRLTDVKILLKAIEQYQNDHGGILPAGVSTISGVIAKNDVDLCPSLVSTYAAQLPVDPLAGSYVDCQHYDTGYRVVASKMLPSLRKITVYAPNAELGEKISVEQ